jgi:hypothetical protein
MEVIDTKYGKLKDASCTEYFSNGAIKECMLNDKCELNTDYGVLVPQFEDNGVRRKHKKSISFYNSGNLKSISLQEQVVITTSIGLIPVEYLTFYEDGNIKRIFPLDGKLSGYWTEDNEYGLAREISFNFKFGNFSKKVIGIYFYNSEEIKSITFWPKEKIIISSPAGPMIIRIGLSLFPDGIIKSVEPARPASVQTRIGKINAYDVNPLGVHGDDNSLKFDEKGEVVELTTSTDTIKLTDKKGNTKIFEPGSKQSVIDDEETEIIPINIKFLDEKVMFNNDFKKEYLISDCTFTVESGQLAKENLCSSCESCNGCSF